MRFLRKSLASALAAFTVIPAARPDAYHASPKLVIILVIDQFRGDYLERYRDDITTPNGFNLFLKRGAYFNDCMFGYANTKTAPGHASIGTGAYTDGHSIGSNEWWDLSRNTVRTVSSVEDDRYRQVGTYDDLPMPPSGIDPKTPITGSSPRNLLATTVGDELRLATQGQSRVYGISLKDRAAILPAGQSANAAYWIDNVTGRYVSSTYYMQQLPGWVTAFNKGPRPALAAKEAGFPGTLQFYSQVGITDAANGYELDFAQDLIRNEKLGQGKTTDLLTVSLSANDIGGHLMGPDSDQQLAMVKGLDQDLNNFFTRLDQTVGLNNVVIAFTADHGIAPVPSIVSQYGISSASLDLDTFTQKMNTALAQRFAVAPPRPESRTTRSNQMTRQAAAQDRSALGTRTPSANLPANPTGPGRFLLPTQELPYIALDPRAFKAINASEADAESAFEELAPGILRSMGAPQEPPVTSLMPDPKHVYSEKRLDTDANVVFLRSRTQLAAGELPNTPFGQLLAHSYTDHGGWYVMMIPQAYQMELLNDIRTTHFSPWSYDRHVPLGFFGTEFVPGIYRQAAAPVDISVTISNLLGINRPSAAVGRVLTEALKPATQP